MLVVTLQVFEQVGQTPGINYNESGKIQNPNYVVKLDEFVYMNKWLPRFQMMGYAKVDFVDACEIKEIPGKVGQRIELPETKVNELKKALVDKLSNVKPEPAKTALEIENDLLKARLERQEQAIERLESRILEQVPNDVPKVPKTKKPIKE